MQAWASIYLWTGGGLVVFYLVSLALDSFVCRHLNNHAYTAQETKLNLHITGLMLLTRIGFTQAVAMTGLSWAASYRFFNLGDFSALVIFACFVGVDFLYYWDHRLSHRVPAIWAFHRIHHSSTEYNISVTGRLSCFEGLYRWVFLVPLAVLGFPVFMILTMKLLSRGYQVWVHSVLDKNRFEGLGALFVTPGLHRNHHSLDRNLHDANYGAILSIWDRFFATFKPTQEARPYGCEPPLQTTNAFAINFETLKYFWRLRQHLRAWR